MHDFDPQGSNLIFLISLPRSGSTLLQRILSGHPDIATLAEPWLMLHPLYALKRQGINTEYDANLARTALEDFLSQLDGGETAYVEGIRRFAGDLYARALARQDKRLFLDKTPRYYRIIPELRQVFPRAKFIILLRNPLAALASTLRTWFKDDPGLLNGTTNHRDLLDGPVLLRAALEMLGDDAIVVRYEELVAEPERVVAGLCAGLGLAFHPVMLDYGRRPAPPGRFGDQVGVPRHSRATAEHRDKWVSYLHDPARRFWALDYLDQLGDATPAALGYDINELRKTLLAAQTPGAAGVEDETPRARADRLNAEGESRFAQSDFEAARQCFEAACASDPDFATARNNLMVLFWETGQAEDALTCLADALTQTPDDRNLIMNGAQILHALGLADEARGLCLRYLDQHPDAAEVRALLVDTAAPEHTPIPSARPEPPETTGSALDIITIATSIAPKGIEKQQHAIASWHALGFHVVSLNTPEEIAELRAQFPQVEFFAVKRHGKQLAGKPYVFLDDVLAHLRDAAKGRICGIVNSDIILRAGPEFSAYLWRESRDALVYGSRVDIDAAEDAEGQVYHRGFDFFFFDRAIIDRLPKTNFMLGVPWWDYWMPVGFQLAGVTIRRLDSRIAFHVRHVANYSAEILMKFGREFVERCAGTPFVGLYAQTLGTPLTKAAFSVLSDAAIEYISRNTVKIAMPGVLGTEPMRTGRPCVSAIVSTYKSSAFIAECLEDLVGQTIADRLEIIVIDAASPENERSIVSDYQRRYPNIPIRYHRTESRIGVYAAWNMAIRMARGDYLISCSTNDRLRSDACEVLARTLDERPDVALVYGNSFMTKLPHQSFEKVELCSLYLWPAYSYEDLIDHCRVGPHPMWRRDVHERIGYFGEQYIALGDQEFWLRLGEHENLLNIPDFTGIYYVSEDSLSGDGDIAQREMDAIHMKYQWRHRYSRWARLTGKRRAGDYSAETLPTIHVLVLVPPEGLSGAADTLDGLCDQHYTQMRVSILADRPPPDVSLLDDGGIEWSCYSSVEHALQQVGDMAESTTAEWLCIIDAGDRLGASSLVDAARYALRNPEWRMLYGDDDLSDEGGEQRTPRFKPDFNLGMLRSQPYIGGCVLIRPAALTAAGGLSGLADWRGSDLALRVADQFGSEAVGHMPRIFVHYAGDRMARWASLLSGNEYRDCVQAHLQRRGMEAEILAGQSEGILHVRPVCHDFSMVSIVVHGGGAADRQLALRTLLSNTSYGNYEVLIIQDADDRSIDLDSFQNAERIRIVQTRDMSPGAAMNVAAAAARGNYILWLDGRCLILQADWIERLLMQISDPDVGIVGARLVDRRKALLDGGVVLGLGARCVGARINTGLHMSTPGYLGRAVCEQDLSAVTSLCMLVRKTVHAEIGGFAQDISTGSYRDVDYCLKAGTTGRRIVWTPAVTLMFLGSNVDADRPPENEMIVQAENTLMLDRWFGHIAQEPAFNRNLSHRRTDFQLEMNTVPSWDPIVDSMPRILGYGAGSYGSWQYRVNQPLETLESMGKAQCTQTPFLEKTAVTLPTPVDIEHMQPHTLLLHNTLHDDYLDMIAQYRRHNRVSLVFGQDDLMFALPPKNPYSKTVYKDIKKRIRRCIELCDRVVVTTEPLADALRGFSAQIDIVPNYLPRTIWEGLQSTRRDGRRPRVGWAGAQQHGGDLELLYEVVTATAEEVDWVFFGMCPRQLRPYVREIHGPVDFAEYPARLSGLDLDLAVAPLEHNRFNEAKSNLRILEYGVLGWPVIASDIHPYRNGPITRVANNPAAWVKAIREHLSDPDALAQAGDELRSWVRANWMLEDHCDQWLSVLCPNGARSGDEFSGKRSAIA
ncbi:MAG: sulfotransferase [Pseudomonadota bacterium]